MIILGTYNYTDPWFGYAYGLAMSMSNNIGYDVGNYIYYSEENRNYKCQITDKKDNKLQLVGIGWVNEEKYSVEYPENNV